MGFHLTTEKVRGERRWTRPSVRGRDKKSTIRLKKAKKINVSQGRQDGILILREREQRLKGD